ncbi:putative tyramine receptor 2 [Erpetoichthys calabaricus]|uniref:putative tyramine receptor 2 n=1 Tax=Erpetoichthys calabaricus TaxID=27687 RepID=UPI002233E5D9|nr:putative tyramine receptor 2 [Erpetoichthys calabaricus]
MGSSDIPNNLRNSTSGELIHLMSLLAHGLILSLTFLAGVAGNTLVIWAVYRKAALQTPNNALLVNLAVGDLLRCLIDIPLLLTIVLLGDRRQDLGTGPCHAQVFAFSLSCCVQLFTLASIGAERYQAIAHPFKTAKRKKRVRVLIPLTWLGAALISAACIAFVKSTPVYAVCRGMAVHVCVYRDSFGLYVLVPVWLASLGFIVGFYARIYLLVKTHAKKIFDEGLHPSMGKTQEGNSAGVRTQDNSAASPAAPQTVVNEQMSSALKTQSQQDQASGCPPLKADSIEAPQVQTIVGQQAVDQPAGIDCAASRAPHMETEDGRLAATAPPVEIVGAVCIMPKGNREKARKRTEGKLAKRSGYIILTFLALWLPLIVLVIFNFIVCHSNTAIQLALEGEIFATAVTCTTSAINPITYAVVNPQFRTEFQQLRIKVISKLCSRVT